jgi:hypothetical protein
MAPLLVVAAKALEGCMTISAVPLVGRELRAEEREQFDLSRVAEGAGDSAFIVFSLFVDALSGRHISRPSVLLSILVVHDM